MSSSSLGYKKKEAELTRKSYKKGQSADVNTRNKQSHTVLLHAANWGHAESVRLLLVAGSDVEVADNRGNTALKLVFKNSHFINVFLLLKAGAFKSLFK